MIRRPHILAGMLRHPCPRTLRGSGIVAVLCLLCACLSSSGQAWGDSFGKTTCGVSGFATIEAVIKGWVSPAMTPSADGTLDSIQACIHVLNSVANTTCDMRAGVYTWLGFAGGGTGALVDTCTPISFLTWNGESQDTTVWLYFVANAAITAGTIYTPVLWATQSANFSVTVAYDATAGDTLVADNETFTNAWPADLTVGITAAREASIAVYYTVTPVGGIPPRRRRMLMGSQVLVTEAVRNFAGWDDEIAE